MGNEIRNDSSMTSMERGQTETDVRKRLEKVIADSALKIAFQPIVSFKTSEVIGYEALTRPDPDSGFANPFELFSAAYEHNLTREVENTAHREVFRRAIEIPESVLIFFNNSPEVFHASDYIASLDNMHEEVLKSAPAGSEEKLSPSRFVIEVTEHITESEYPFEETRKRVQDLRSLGYQVAIDDVGAGTSGLNRLMAMRPDWIKLDIELISGIDHDPFKQNLLRFFVSFARMSNIQIIAEGIELDSELTTLIDLSAIHGQGFLLGRPEKQLKEIDDKIKKRILVLSGWAEARKFNDPRSMELESIAVTVPSFDISDTVENAHLRLERIPGINGGALADGRRFMGWLCTSTIQQAIDDDKGGLSLDNLDVTECRMVAGDMRFQEALHFLSSADSEEILTPLIIRKSNGKFGCVTLNRLLSAASSSDWIATRVAPLTGLPNRVAADHWLQEKIKEGDACNIAFIDLKQFGAYNIAYGFDMGDAMLRRLVGLIRAELLEGSVGDNDFIAHLGEDRFLFTCQFDPTSRLVKLMEQFEELRSELFSSEAIVNNCYIVNEPSGSTRILPLTTIRVILLQSPLLNVANPSEIHGVAWKLSARDVSDDVPPIQRIITENRNNETSYRASA